MSAEPSFSYRPWLPPLLGVATVNGIFSPATPIAYVLAGLWYPGFVPFSPAVALFMASLAVSTLTLIVAGVPAALFERITGRTEASIAAAWIWLAGVMLLSLPAIQNFVAIGF